MHLETKLVKLICVISDVIFRCAVARCCWHYDYSYLCIL